MSHTYSLGDFDVITGPAAPSRPIAPASLQTTVAPGAASSERPEAVREPAASAKPSATAPPP